MPTKQMVRVTKARNKKRVRISLSFGFNADDPQAQRIYNGIGLCLKEALTEDEAVEFMRQFEAERAKLVA